LRSGSVLAPVAHAHISNLGVLVAIRLSRQRSGVAEMEARRSGLADRPAAGELAPAEAGQAERRRACPGGRSGRIGEGRPGSDRRCALPMMAFFETPMRRPISAVE
jgi:hypothetical protein